MSIHNKKQKEKLHFAIFRECCMDIPKGLIDDDRENPDFVVNHSKGILGIEHTQLFKVTNHPNAPQALEALRQQIVESAQEYCKDIPPLYVRVWFTYNQKVPKNRKSEIKRISRLLAAIIKRWHRKNPLGFQSDRLKPPEIPTIFFIIYIARIGSKHNWAVNNSAYQLNYPIVEIQSCIDEKNCKCKEYLKSCDECWLLIVINRFKDPQSFEMDDPSGHKYESKFERIFLMDVSHRKELRELPIRPITC